MVTIVGNIGQRLLNMNLCGLLKYVLSYTESNMTDHYVYPIL